MSEVPKNLVVVGGGYMGLGGSVWSRLGSNVTVIEYLDRIMGLDMEVSSTFQKILSKQD